MILRFVLDRFFYILLSLSYVADGRVPSVGCCPFMDSGDGSGRYSGCEGRGAWNCYRGEALSQLLLYGGTGGAQEIVIGM